MANTEFQRTNADENVGLSLAQVAERKDAKATNYVRRTVGKSYGAIFFGNIFTFFNFLGLFVFVVMAIVGSWENMVFCVVILCNTVIGIVQEIRSKLTVEKLSLVTAPTAKVVRGGQAEIVATAEVVLDDVMLLENGKQICCDCEVLSGEIEVNEAMLTGESDNVKKKKGDKLFSGSFVVAGSCRARAVAVGSDSYVEKLSSRVKKYKKPSSELMKSINSIIMGIAVVIFPLGIATLLKGFYVGGLTFRASVIKACGAMIGMVPSGMVLLTSIALAVSVIKLAKKNCLVQDLYCIEMLARVDTLCLDKTGTITDGTMTVEEVVGFSDVDVGKAVGELLAATEDDNFTARALKQKFPLCAGNKCLEKMPFSSKRKFSAASFVGGTVAVGAAEFIFKNIPYEVKKASDAMLKRGLRVLAVGVSDGKICDGDLPEMTCAALVALSDTIREDAPQIVKWFKENDVEVKIISGDNPLSVSVIAAKVGVENADKYISLDGLTDEQVADAATKFTVFGRVSPDQKALLIKTLKQNGRTVAMTGDGVNDILAMREANCAVSVACGSEAAKSCAHIVLTDNKFSSMPSVVREGRQVVNNIQNSSTLYLMKTTMTVLTTVMLLFAAYSYPFEAQHLYAFEFFINGVPAFFLALRPNSNLIKGRFLDNVFKKTLPCGVGVWAAVALTYIFANAMGIASNADAITTAAMYAMTITGVCALIMLCIPFDRLNALAAGFSALLTPLALFYIVPWALSFIKSADATPYAVALNTKQSWFVLLIICISVAVIVLGKLLVKYLDKRRKQNA